MYTHNASFYLLVSFDSRSGLKTLISNMEIKWKKEELFQKLYNPLESICKDFKEGALLNFLEYSKLN